MRIETKQQPCGMMAYTALEVPYYWSPKPLNHCRCGAEIKRWTAKVGHWCDVCKASACDKSCTHAVWERAT